MSSHFLLERVFIKVVCSCWCLCFTIQIRVVNIIRLRNEFTRVWCFIKLKGLILHETRGG